MNINSVIGQIFYGERIKIEIDKDISKISDISNELEEMIEGIKCPELKKFIYLQRENPNLGECFERVIRDIANPILEYQNGKPKGLSDAIKISRMYKLNNISDYLIKIKD